MRTKQYRVALTDTERAELHLLVRRGQAPARVIRRAHILLEADADAFDHDTARALHTSVATVWRVRRRFAEAPPDARLDRALYDRPRPGVQPKSAPSSSGAWRTSRISTRPRPIPPGRSSASMSGLWRCGGTPVPGRPVHPGAPPAGITSMSARGPATCSSLWPRTPGGGR